jgi:uncharacterized coiled-coil protein SlyX
VTELKEWVRANSTLVYFLMAQAAAGIGIGVSMVSYMVRLEARVSTLEIRGSPHLGEIDRRLTVLESQTRSNKDSIERIVDVMTRELGKTVK